MLLFFLLNLLALCKSKHIRRKGKCNVYSIMCKLLFVESVIHILHVYIWFFQLYCILYQTEIFMFCLFCIHFLHFSHTGTVDDGSQLCIFFLCFFFPFLFSGLRHAAWQILVPQGPNPALCSESAES